jgi:hypothetical protein
MSAVSQFVLELEMLDSKLAELLKECEKYPARRKRFTRELQARIPKIDRKLRKLLGVWYYK